MRKAFVLSIFTLPLQLNTKNSSTKTLTNWIDRYRLNDGNVIIGGDYNCVHHPLVDGKNKSGHYKKIKSLYKLIAKLDLCDIWRKLHPDTKQFTRRQLSLNIASIIDFWLITKPMAYYKANGSCYCQL